MSEVRWSDQAVQQADERRQLEKSDEEKRQSKAAFEKRLQQDRTQKETLHKATQSEAQGKQAAQEKANAAGREQTQAQQAQAQKGKAAAQKKPAADTKQESAVLAHVRQQAAQQGQHMTRLPGRPQLPVPGALAQSVQRDLDKAATQSQETGRTLVQGRDEAQGAARADEQSRLKELDEKDDVKDKDVQAARAEAKQEAQQAQGAQQTATAAAGRVDGDGRRGGGGQQGGGEQGGQKGGAKDVSEVEQKNAPSAQALARAEKTAEIQKLCEKLLDNFYLGAAPDGSAMMRMELKEGVLAGLVIDVKVDSNRRVKLSLSGGNKEAINFVTSSRGELARTLGKKGLVLESVDAT